MACGRTPAGSSMIGIIDYGMGNLGSVANALEYLGAEGTVSSDPEVLGSCERLILPGVGAFGAAMARLREHQLIEFLHDTVVHERKPLLGVCLGMQLLAESSEEHGEHEGLGWIPGRVRRFTSDESTLRVPHMGWNAVEATRPHPLLDGFDPNREHNFYFVHSYHFDPAVDEDLVASASHGARFAAMVVRDNVAGVQFHPEKSQDNGLQFLQNFLEWTP